MKKNQKNRFLIYKPDHCLRYIPRHDFRSFKEEMRHTDNQLIQYLPSQIKKYHQSFIFIKRISEIIFLGGALTLMTFFERIKFIKRNVTNKWAIFGLKGGILLTSIWSVYTLGQNVYEQHFLQIYKQIRDEYRSYKLTGDILFLNSKIMIQKQQEIYSKSVL